MINSSGMKRVSICLLLFGIFIGGSVRALQGQYLDTNGSSADTLDSGTGDQNNRPAYSRQSDPGAVCTNYTATIEISFKNQSLIEELQTILKNISKYDPLLQSSIDVIRAKVSSVCTLNGTVTLCKCDAGYKCAGTLTDSTCSCNSTQGAECCTAVDGIEFSPSDPYIGDTLNITCYFNGSATNISWYHNSSLLSSNSTHNNLNIANISWTDAGTYRCEAYVNSTLKTVSDSIVVKSLNITDSGNIVAVCNGTTYNLTCCSDASNLSVTWDISGLMKIEGKATSHDTCHTYTLQPDLSHCPSDQSGSITTYTCKFTRIYGATGERKINVTYIRKDGIEFSPSDPYIGDTLNITCYFNGSATSISWYHNSSQLTSNSTHTIKDNNLNIAKISWTDAGTYSCEAYVNSTLKTVSDSIGVKSLNISHSGDVVAVCNGATYNLTCCSDASNSSVTWDISGLMKIEGKATSHDTCHTYTLQPDLSHCPSDQSGSITTYTCKFTRIYGATGERKISVTYIRKAVDGIEFSPSDPYIGDTLNITCYFNGSATNISWYHNSSWLTSNSTHTIKDNNLNIAKINWTDAGTYSCEAYVNTTLKTVSNSIVIKSLNINQSVDVIAVCNGTTYNLTCSSDASNLSVTWDISGLMKIEGKATSHDTYHIYTLQPDLSHCPTDLSGSITTYTCKFTRIYGATGERKISVAYIRKAIVQIIPVKPVSASSYLEITCQSDIMNSNTRVIWEKDNKAMSKYANQTKINATDVSTLWSGTYTCIVSQLDVNSSDSEHVSIVPLPKEEEIHITPIEITSHCNTNLTVTCCCNDDKNYSVTFTYYQNSIQGNFTGTKTNENKDLVCYSAVYNVACDSQVTQEINCQVTNQLGNTASSKKMTVKYWSEVGYGTCKENKEEGLPESPDGSKYVAMCKGFGELGNITYTCLNGEWEGKRYCVSADLFDLWVTSKLLSNVPQLEITLPIFLQNFSDVSINQTVNISRSEEDIKLMVDIISKISMLNVTINSSMTEHLFNAVDVMLKNSTTWENIRDLGPSVLQAVENITAKIQNISFETNESNNNVRLKQEIVQPHETYETFFTLNNLTGNVTIENSSLTGGNKTIVSVAYSTMKDILKPKSETFINGLVISTVIKEGKNATDFSISLSFKKHNFSLIDPQCVYWDFTLQPAGGWNSDNCKPTIEKDVVTCKCQHLTSFSILMSGISNPFLDYITYIGVAISIASLVTALIIEYLVWRSVIKNKTSYMRHVCLVNIAVSLLVADIWLMIGAGLEKYPKSDACSAAAFFSFYFYLALFFWMFTTGLLLFHRMVFTLQELSRKTLMITAFCLGYGCPLIIAVTTVAITAPGKQFTSGTFCWLNYRESKAFLAFVVPALTIVFINFIIMLVVISKLLRPSIGEKPGKEETLVLSQIAKSVAVLTPLLGLTWGFGLAVVFKPDNIVYHGIFAVLNSLQGLLILISTVLLDKKVRNIVRTTITSSKWSTSRSRGPRSSNFSSQPSDQKRRTRLPKKGGYNIFKGSSNDTSTNSLSTS